MYTEALNTYLLIVKNKMFNNGARLRINMGNIYFEQRKYPQAIKMYRMALDQIQNTHTLLRYIRMCVPTYGRVRVCVCVCVCARVCVYSTYVCTIHIILCFTFAYMHCTYVHTSLCMRMYCAYVSMYVCMYSTYVCICMFICECMYVRIRVHAYIRRCDTVCVCVYVYEVCTVLACLLTFVVCTYVPCTH